tara:strand:+ start:724 stop:1101 length:378 start_codon:yes stop_codon:yes gene_type:complete
MKIQIHTYPHGPAIGLPHDEIVSAAGLRGRFSDARVGQLEEGDQYIMPIQTELTPRTDTQLLALMAEKQLRTIYVNNIIEPHLRTIVIVTSECTELCDHEYNSGECSDLDALRDALNFILDQDEI